LPALLIDGCYGIGPEFKMIGEQGDFAFIFTIPDHYPAYKEYRGNWARLIQKIYETDPLCCPRCSGKMKVISVIEDQDVIKKILKHLADYGRLSLGLRPKPPAQLRSPNTASISGYMSTRSILRLGLPDFWKKNRVQRVTSPKFPPFSALPAS